MKWIRERDALIAQTLAFVQSVTGKKDHVLQPGVPAAATTVEVESIAVEVVAVRTEVSEASPPAVQPPQPAAVPGLRTGGDFRAEMQGRIASFRKHQERFEREREEYCAATLSRLRAALRDGSRPPAQN